MPPTPAASHGFFFSLERLRKLPLAPDAWFALLEELAAGCLVGNPDRLPLFGELAEHHSHAFKQAYEQRAWAEAISHHDALLDLIPELVAGLPDRAEEFWTHYGLLIAFYAAAVHPVVLGLDEADDPPSLRQRAELAWDTHHILKRASGWSVKCPDWLDVFERQLVEVGMRHWRALALEFGAEASVERRRALSLLDRLVVISEPIPDCIHEQQCELIEAELNYLLRGDGIEVDATRTFIESLQSSPVSSDQRAALRVVLARVHLALELMSPPDPSAPVETKPSVSYPAPSEPDVAELVLLPEQGVATALQFDLRPFLRGEAVEIDDVLDDFVWHLPRGSRAEPAAAGLLRVLEPHWVKGLRLTPPVFEQLAQLAAAWQRRLASRLQPMHQLEWAHGLGVELKATELAVLVPLLNDPGSLEKALGEIRRQHHNKVFWQERDELPWMMCPPPLEALRRLHAEEGYYARTHESLDELSSWGGEAIQALLEAELWTDDAGCLRLWLAVAQALVAKGLGPLPPLGSPPTPDHLLLALAGQEVVYVGVDAPVVQSAHRQGALFRGDPFGLRVLLPPLSAWPARPAGGFSESLAVLLEKVDRLYRERPFAVLLADCGAYRLPLLHVVHQRYGIPGLSCGTSMAGWLTN